MAALPRHYERAAAIGEICLRWANIEYIVAFTIWTMLKLEEGTGKIVTGGLDMQPRINMAINLGRHLKSPKAVLDGLTALRAKIQDGMDIRRNRAVHGTTFIGDDMKTLEVEVHRGKGDRTRRPLPNEELIGLAEEIRTAYVAYITVLTDAGWLDMTSIEEVTAKYIRATAEDAASLKGS